MTDRIHVTMNVDLFVEDATAMREAAFARMREAWTSEEDFPYESANDVPLDQVVHSLLADALPAELPGCRRSRLEVESEDSGSEADQEGTSDDAGSDAEGSSTTDSETSSDDESDQGDGSASDSARSAADAGDDSSAGDTSDADASDDDTDGDADANDDQKTS